MRRRIAIALLTIGTFAGYAAGFASMHHRMEWRRARFERHVAGICAEAARNADAHAARPPAALPDED